jgi:hypothetical protein
MNQPFPIQLDPMLWKKTRVTHLVLFTLGSLLLFPSALVAYFSMMLMRHGGIGHTGTLINPIHAAIAGTGCGVLAWSALGLLFFKRADPGFHLVAWSSVILFSLVAGSGCYVWLTMGGGDLEWITVTLWVVVAACLFGLVAGVRNLMLALNSRRRMKVELEVFLGRRTSDLPFNPPN